MKKLITMMMMLSLVVFAVSCGNKTTDNGDNGGGGTDVKPDSADLTVVPKSADAIKLGGNVDAEVTVGVTGTGATLNAPFVITLTGELGVDKSNIGLAMSQLLTEGVVADGEIAGFIKEMEKLVTLTKATSATYSKVDVTQLMNPQGTVDAKYTITVKNGTTTEKEHFFTIKAADGLKLIDNFSTLSILNAKTGAGAGEADYPVLTIKADGTIDAADVGGATGTAWELTIAGSADTTATVVGDALKLAFNNALTDATVQNFTVTTVAFNPTTGSAPLDVKVTLTLVVADADHLFAGNKTEKKIEIFAQIKTHGLE